MQLLVRLGLDATGYETGLKKAKSSAEGFGHHLKSEVGGKIAGVFGAAAFEEGIRRTAEWAEKIKNLSSRTGLPLEEMQKLDFIAQTTGVDVMKVVKAIEAVGLAQAKAVAGDQDARSGLQGLGLTDAQIDDLGRTKENFYAIAAGIQGIDDADLSNVLLAFDKLGKGGKAFRDLLPAMREGLDMAADGFVPMADATLEKMAKLNHLFETIGQSGKLFFGTIVSGWMQLGEFIAGATTAFFKGGEGDNSISQMLNGGADFISKQEGIDAMVESAEKRADAALRSSGKSLAEWRQMKAEADAVGKAQADNVAALNSKTAVLQEEKRKAGLTPAARRAELQQEIDSLKAQLANEGDIFGIMTPIEKAKKRHQLAEDELEMSKMKPDKEDKKKDPFAALYKLGKPEGNSLLDVGNYLGSNPDRAQIEKLDVLHQDLQKILQKDAIGASVNFPV